MAQQQTGFAYHNIELYKSKSLGSGSYGRVCKAKCDGLLCAAKIMHPTLFDLHDPGTDFCLRKFREECRLLSLSRHPNVVQYLDTYYDPDTRLPVLLMELCDESLTAFLERSPGSLSYHIQLNICHDITLALVYLHSNRVIHRDLTGNNVLMIPGTRAKITDFGMSKLATGNPRMTVLCPGNSLYMSPEALDEAKNYTAKLDIFSFGVIVIQTLTLQFPNPTDRFQLVYSSEFNEEIRRVVPELERREAHLKLIPDTHSLKPLALECLKKEFDRPSALQLSERLSELKEYTESMHETQSSSDIQQLQQQIQGQRLLTEAITRKAQEYQTQITELQSIVVEKDRLLQECQRKIASLECASRDTLQRLTWRTGKNAPEKMTRRSAVVYNSTAYFRPFDSVKVYSYQNILGEEQWSQLPDNTNINCGLAVIDGLLTSVGGCNNVYTNTLLSLTEEGRREQWYEVFSPLPTPRQSVACITTEQYLVVAGGYGYSHCLDTVEVMDINTKQWTAVTPLPQKQSQLSAIVCGNRLYLAGSIGIGYEPSKSVFSCSLPDLLTSSNLIGQHQCQNVWREISSLPVTVSTLASLNGQLLAIGGYI